MVAISVRDGLSRLCSLKMRILFVTRTFYPATEYGGPVTSLRRISRSLVAAGHTVSVVCSNMGSPGMRGKRLPVGQFDVEGAQVTYLSTPVRFHWEGISLGARRQLRRHVISNDIVHVWGVRHYLGALAIHEATRRRRPYLVAPEGSIPARSRNLFLKRVVDYFHTRRTFARAFRVVATSEQEAQDLLEWGISAAQLVILPPRADPVRPSPQDRDALRRSWSLPPDAPVLLWIGRFNREKGLPLLMEALNDPRLRGAQVILAGPPEDRLLLTRLRATADSPPLKGRIRFLGWVGDDTKAELYKLADVFVFPSRKENFGLAAAEAVASGLPVVLTEACAVADVIKDDAGIVCEYRVEALADAVASLTSDTALLQRLRTGTAIAASRLEWPPLTELFERVYRQALT
jgi:glycosyltransferase involved in cell wall biosynthesis